MTRSKICMLLCLACVAVPSMAQNSAAIYRPTILRSVDPNYYYPNLLNNRGDYTIVGMSDGATPFKDALYYAAGGEARMGSIHALNDLGQAVGSDFVRMSRNEVGQILAMTCPRPFGGSCDVVRLDFVSIIPEPPVWAMMAVGLLLTAQRRLRRVGDRPQRGLSPDL